MQKVENSIFTENKILIVDDTAIDLKLLTKILHEEGLKVVQAKSGLEALASISKDPPDLILMDIRMPEMDGFEVCTQLKNNQATREIPIVFLSSISDKNVIAKGFQLGGADYITKPIVKEEVLARVNTQLSLLKMQMDFKSQKQKLLIEISNRSHIESNLLESEKRFRLLFDNAPLSYQSLDKNACLIDVNPTWLITLGYQKEEVIGRYFGDFMTPESEMNIKLRFEKFISDGEIHDYRFEMIRKDGTHFMVSYEGRIGADEFGNFKQTHCIFTDITNNLSAEKAIRESELKFRTIFENANEGICGADKNLVITYVNQKMADLTGYTIDELVGMNYINIILPDDYTEVYKIEEERNTGEFGTYERCLLTKNKQIIWTLVSSSPLFSDEGIYMGSVGMFTDITQRKKIQEDLRESEEIYRNLIDNMPDGVYKSTHDGKFLEVNQAMVNILGYNSKQELMEVDIKKELYFEATDRDSLTLEELNKELDTFRMRKKDGSEIWVEDHGWYTLDSDENILFHEGIMRDVSDRILAEIKIKTLSKAIEQSPISIIITNAEGLIEFVNNEFISFTQYSFEEVKGKKPRIFNPGHLPEQDFNEMWETLKNGNTWKCEFSNRKKDESLFTEEVIISTMQNIEGKISHYILIMEDITERKLILDDLVISKEKAEESDRLKTAFLHNISHEIRTPMNAIVGFSGIINQPDINVEDRQKYTDIIVNSSNQLLSIITDIVSMATIEAGQEKAYTKLVNLNAIGRRVYDQFSIISQKRNINLSFIPGLIDEDAAFVTDEIKLVQVLTNLVGNALKFTFEGFVEFGYIIDKGQLKFHIKDSGIGIAPELHQEIFKRFRQVETTTVRQFGGSGLGLSISKAYIDLLGGEIWIESVPEKGTTFFFTLPYEKQNQQISSTIEKNAGIQIEENTTILIAEDEDSNFVLLEVILASTTLSLIRVKTGFEAVEKCKTNPAISLVLMDIKMPGMDGYEATQKIKTMLPDLPVIALTAFSTEADQNKAFASGCSDFISKPFKRDKLLSIINKHLKR